MARFTQEQLDGLLKRNKHITINTGRIDDQAPAQVPHPKPTKQARALETNGQRETPGTGRPLVRFTLSRVRLLDADAKWGSVKDVLDGLQYAGLIRGDREDQIELEVRQIKVSSFKAETTKVEIIYP